MIYTLNQLFKVIDEIKSKDEFFLNWQVENLD